MPSLWVGVDAGKRKHHCAVLDAEGKILLSQAVANDETALLELIANVLTLAGDASARYLRENDVSYREDLAATERKNGERFVGAIGATTWFTPFAPIGFNEVRAVVRGRRKLELDADDVTDLATSLTRVLTWYASLCLNSFNLSLLSGLLDGGNGYRVNLTMISRTAMVPYYRSDAMVLERLHWEAAIDRTPEANAEALRELG
jgi:galactose-1-phosphate uridylyltransferase